MRFQEIIAQIREQGDDPLPPGIYDDLTAEYTGLSEASTAKVQELQSQVQNYESEISRLKSKNYDLLMSSAGDSGGDNSDKETGPKDNQPAGTDSLFG